MICFRVFAHYIINVGTQSSRSHQKGMGANNHTEGIQEEKAAEHSMSTPITLPYTLNTSGLSTLCKAWMGQYFSSVRVTKLPALSV